MAENLKIDLPPQNRASLGASVVSGLSGMISGGIGLAISGGALAAMAAAAAAIIPGGLELVQGVIGAALPDMAAATYATTAGAVGYAGAIGAMAAAPVGALLGGMAGVVKSREITGARIEDIAKMSFAQGVAVGHALEVQEQQMAQESTKFRDMVGKPQKAESFQEMVEVKAAQVTSGKLH